MQKYSVNMVQHKKTRKAGGVEDMKIFVVLHGQTDLDAEGRVQGKSDQPLNDTGREQAHETAKALQSKGIDMIMMAPQNRTLETAAIIAGQIGVEENRMVKGMKLPERDFGDYEGQLTAEMDMYALCSWTGNAPTPNGETIRDTAARVILYINNMVKLAFKGKTVLLVVSEHVLRVLFWYFYGLPEAGQEQIIEIDPRSIYEFESDEVPPEMKDFQLILDQLNSDDGGKGSSDRVLSQSEIDRLMAEMMSG